ncbi:MAG: DUF5130 family protein [Acidimicrobiales bacterium]
MSAGRGREPRGLRRAVDKAVAAAEARTGLQFCVVIDDAGDHPRDKAEQLFVGAGLAARPSVMVLIDPVHHKVEVVTARAVRPRIGDPAAEAAVAEMTTWFAAGDLTGGLVAGIRFLAAAAGAGDADAGSVDLPNVV